MYTYGIAMYSFCTYAWLERISNTLGRWKVVIEVHQLAKATSEGPPNPSDRYSKFVCIYKVVPPK